MSKKSTLVNIVYLIIPAMVSLIILMYLIFIAWTFYPNLFSFLKPEFSGDIIVCYEPDPELEFYVSYSDFNNQKTDGYIYINMENDNKTDKKYKYNCPTTDSGNPYVDLNETESMLVSAINQNYVVTNFKNDRMHRNRLSKNKINQLLFLNEETLQTEVLYECYDTDRIIYGDKSTVILLNGEENSIQYISLSDDKILHEVALNWDLRLDTSFDVYTDENKIVIEQFYSGFSKNKATQIPITQE